MPPDETQTPRRLFFALWPDAAVCTALAELARQQTRGNGRTVPATNLHLTLAFLGQVDATRQACMEAAAGRVAAESFELTIDHLGFWPRPHILWAGASTMPAALLGLVVSLNRELVSCGYQPERRPYQAHVTLARKARRAPARAEIPPIAWPAADFCLVQSVADLDGSRYEIVRRWPLSPAA